MAPEPYLARLTAKLAAGLQQKPASFRERHAGYVLSCQNADGGFGGRDSASDLYYTGFALRCLVLLDELTQRIAERTAGYLRSRLSGQATPIDFFSLLYSCLLIQTTTGIDVLEGVAEDWPERVVGLLESFRSKDGGYGKSPGATAGSTYHTFLVALCYQLLNRPLPDAGAIVSFIRSRRRADGGFVEIGPMKRSGTNPTAAAVGILQIAEQLHEDELNSVSLFLVGLQSPEGGLRANNVAPAADLLSTFTGCWTLSEFGNLGSIDIEAALKYVKTLERPDGGFHGGAWDGGFDVEYTFYGLGALSLLEPLATSPSNSSSTIG
ncbi:MAG TPA: prenyltransferase/squalene oxidase repeat-containing protein [Gemmataceae bacterium]|jgi:geranylgeranyl transferase type-2 subunit beta|nr:prenyltransferase/squalene oxidase repeat-containing protein [Gemmataceae bacterium]